MCLHAYVAQFRGVPPQTNPCFGLQFSSCLTGCLCLSCRLAVGETTETEEKGTPEDTNRALPPPETDDDEGKAAPTVSDGEAEERHPEANGHSTEVAPETSE